ncbi:MAG: HYR domain-containing protein [Bacteroidales bacterium]|nr:HYR domain-containing protein [Bacteroidales bacterium]
MKIFSFKISVLTFFLTLFSALVSAQYTSLNNHTGSFTDAGSWENNSAPNPAGIDDDTNIYGYITCDTGITINKYKTVTVYDTLLIHGDLFIDLDANFIIETGAVCIIYGNVTAKNKVDLAFGSHFVVTGNFDATGGQTTVDINSGAAIYILGTVTASNLPELECVSGTSDYIPPGDINCARGDIISLEDNENNDDGIYDFFVGGDELKGVTPVYTELCGITDITISALFNRGTNYTWLDSLGITVGTGTSFTTDQPGEYYATFQYKDETVTTYRAKVVTPNMNATVNSTDVTCPGNSDGTITISSPSGGSGTYEYTINGDIGWQSSGNFTGLTNGIYDVRIRDAVSLCEKILNSDLEIVSTDVTPPTITCPNDITITADAGTCEATGISLGTPVTSDNCSVASVINDGSEPYSMGTTTITWTVADVAGNTANCTQNITVVPFDTIDIEVVDFSDDCQSGETGTTTITWDISKTGGTNDWTFNYTVKEGSTTVASGTGIAASGNTQVSYIVTNEAGSIKIFTINITNVADECSTAELITTNNTDDVTLSGVPETSEIFSN